MNQIPRWLGHILLLVALVGCGGTRLEVERSDEINRLLAMRVTFAVDNVSRDDALWAAFEAAKAPITQMSMGEDDEAKVSLDVHDQPISEVIRLIYRDQLADFSFACANGEFAIKASKASSQRRLRAFLEEQRQVGAAHREMTAMVKQCDTIEIAVLGAKQPPTADMPPGFPIAAYDSEVPILRVHRLTSAAEVAGLRSKLVALLASREPGNQALCHFPGYGLRCYREGKLLLETSFCWKCGNYHLVLNGEGQFLAIPGDHTGRELKQALTAITGPVIETPGP